MRQNSMPVIIISQPSLWVEGVCNGSISNETMNCFLHRLEDRLFCILGFPYVYSASINTHEASCQEHHSEHKLHSSNDDLQSSPHKTKLPVNQTSQPGFKPMTSQTQNKGLTTVTQRSPGLKCTK